MLNMFALLVTANLVKWRYPLNNNAYTALPDSMKPPAVAILVDCMVRVVVTCVTLPLISRYSGDGFELRSCNKSTSTQDMILWRCAFSSRYLLTALFVWDMATMKCSKNSAAAWLHHVGFVIMTTLTTDQRLNSSASLASPRNQAQVEGYSVAVVLGAGVNVFGVTSSIWRYRLCQPDDYAGKAVWMRRLTIGQACNTLPFMVALPAVSIIWSTAAGSLEAAEAVLLFIGHLVVCSTEGIFFLNARSIARHFAKKGQSDTGKITADANVIGAEMGRSLSMGGAGMARSKW